MNAELTRMGYTIREYDNYRLMLFKNGEPKAKLFTMAGHEVVVYDVNNRRLGGGFYNINEAVYWFNITQEA